MEKATPVYVLSGFLGSGKTTLLEQWITTLKQAGLKPAIIMNELGEVNLDGLAVDADVPMTEVLGGCICCSGREDLGMQLAELIDSEHPDVIIIEATGAANPMEILDGITETSLFMRMDLKPLVTVVDAAHLLGLYRDQKGKTYRLMQDQIRCASILILNKQDRVTSEELTELGALLNRWNPHAAVYPAVRCKSREVMAWFEDSLNGSGDNGTPWARPVRETSEKHQEEEQAEPPSSPFKVLNASHSHVMVYTHYFEVPVNSEAFEALIAGLPRDVYRAKGVLTFSDTSGRYLFQYAYRASDFMKINPQKPVPDVAVFIGEHFDQQQIRAQLLELEQEARDN
ncbi:GTP-binding protein [Paenibacillus sp. JX-17]|uniref:GTP-binding protein n=1 Tax=Paenibacillus lacisoli TaxID=3064525 RepID=A0ABT9CDR5_9BACL|nr:GTP-binding protein [Paenibacillus sp. JX-17]MDO7905743.1 GTP-binding protein [Paenibacillus sp. JX-17]